MLANLLVFIAIVLMALGGYEDISGKKLWLSREHYWADATFLLLLALYLK